jgi:hypothetical protein
MAVDLGTSTAEELTRPFVNPTQIAMQPAANFSSFGSGSIVQLDEDSLTPRQALLIDRASRLSKNSFAPSASLNHSQAQIPSSDQLQGSLIGNSITPRVDLDSSSSGITATSTPINQTSPEATSIASGAYFAGLFAPSSRSSNSRTLSAVQPAGQQWIGGFCDQSGNLVFPQDHSSTNLAAITPEGEGDDPGENDDSIIPEVDFPTLEISGHSGSLNLFQPPTQSNFSSLATLGAFTPASLANPDLTLPGLNWVHAVDVIWVSPEQWSFTESLVLSFNLGNANNETGNQSIINGTGQDQDGDSTGDDGAEDDENLGLDVADNWQSTTQASRSGYYKFFFSASRGMTTASAAGVRWSVMLDYLDSASVVSETAGVSVFTPSDPPTGSGGSSNADAINAPQYPADFTARSVRQGSVTVSVASVGVILVTSTPAIAADGEIDRTITASISYGVNCDIELSFQWSSFSQSGNIRLAEFPVANGLHPLLNCDINLILPGNEPGDDDGAEANGDWEDSLVSTDGTPDTEASGPMGEIEGTGHASLSNGRSLTKAGGGVNGSFNLTGILRGNRFSSLIGTALAKQETAKERSGGGDHLFAFRDRLVTPTPDGILPAGQTVTTIELTAGWTGKGNGDGSTDADGNIQLGVSSDGATAADNGSTGRVDGKDNAGGNDFINLVFSEKHNSAVDVIFPPPYTGGNFFNNIEDFTSSLDLIYKSESHGKSVGDVYGFASMPDQSAELESELKGKGRSLLVIVTKHDSDFEGITSPEPSRGETADKLTQAEVYLSTFDITGSASGARNEDGSINWQLDAQITQDLMVDYASVLDQHNQSWGNVNGVYQTVSLFNHLRIAEFHASRKTVTRLVGGGIVGLQPEGDTGGLTITEATTRAGDAEVSLMVTQEAIGIVELAVEKNLLERQLEAMINGQDETNGGEPENGTGSSGGTGGSSGGGSGTGGGSVFLAGVSGYYSGLLQGVCNGVNRLQNLAIDSFNGSITGRITNYTLDATESILDVDLPRLEPIEWSRDLVTHESGTPGSWDDTHAWSGILVGDGLLTLVTAGGSAATSLADDAARLASRSGGRTWAWGFGKIADDAAAGAYEAIRESTTDVAAISRYTNLKPSRLEKIKDYLFNNKEWTDADGEIAAAWHRLRTGRGDATDMLLLKHETLEMWLRRVKGLSYQEAHRLANNRFNWQKIIEGTLD